MQENHIKLKTILDDVKSNIIYTLISRLVLEKKHLEHNKKFEIAPSPLCLPRKCKDQRQCTLRQTHTCEFITAGIYSTLHFDLTSEIRKIIFHYSLFLKLQIVLDVTQRKYKNFAKKKTEDNLLQGNKKKIIECRFSPLFWITHLFPKFV